MHDHVYKLIEVCGTSTTSSDDAVRAAMTRAVMSLHHVRWFEVTEIRGQLSEGRIVHWQATVKIGFRLDDDSHAAGAEAVDTSTQSAQEMGT